VSKQDTSDLFELIFEGPADDSKETIQKLKAVFIADLELSIPEVQNILQNAPATVCKNQSKEEITEQYQLIKKAGGKVLLIEPKIRDADEKEDNVLEMKDLSLELDSVLGESESEALDEQYDPASESGKILEADDSIVEPLEFKLDPEQTSEEPKPAEPKPASGKSLEDLQKTLTEPDSEVAFSFEDDSSSTTTPKASTDDTLTAPEDSSAGPKEPQSEAKLEKPEDVDLSDAPLFEFEDSLPTENPETKTVDSTETQAGADSSLFDLDQLGESLAAVKEEDPPVIDVTRKEADNNDEDFDLSIELEESTPAPPTKEEPVSSLPAEKEEDQEDDFGLELSLEEPEEQPPAPPKAEPTTQETEESLDLSLEADPEPSLQTQKAKAALESAQDSAPAASMQLEENTSEPPSLEDEKAIPDKTETPKLADAMKNRKPVKKETEIEEEDPEEGEEDEEELIELQTKKEKKSSYLLEYILPIIIGSAILFAGTYYLFLSFSPDEEIIQQINDSIDKITEPVKKDKAKPKEPQKEEVPAGPKAVFSGGNSDTAVSTTSTFTLSGDKIVSGSISLTTPEPPELTPEEIVTQKQREPWLSKAVIDNFEFIQEENGDLTALGQAKVYIERKRILTKAEFNGRINSETGEITGEIKISHNYSPEPEEEGLTHKTERLDNGKFAFFAVGGISAKKEEPKKKEGLEGEEATAEAEDAGED
jgi:hypothetical protein